MFFDPDRLYRPDDPELRIIAKEQTLAHWRREGRGPAFIKTFNRIYYPGKALNEWLESCTVIPGKAA